VRLRTTDAQDGTDFMAGNLRISYILLIGVLKQWSKADYAPLKVPIFGP
jgi:hypothetical protein